MKFMGDLERSYISENNNPLNWGTSTSNVENAKRALGQLEALVEDAVFLDDDSFNGMKTLESCHQKLQVFCQNETFEYCIVFKIECKMEDSSAE